MVQVATACGRSAHQQKEVVMAAKFAVTGDQRDGIDRKMDEIKRQLRLKGGSPLDPERVGIALQGIVEGRFAEEVVLDPPTPSTYQVTVDYSETLEEMIAAGRYDTRNNNISAEHFPVQGTGKVDVELHLVHLGRDASTDAVLAELDRRGLRPARIEELLALGAKHPNLQKEFPIVALGSVWRGWFGLRSVAYLEGWRGGRRLGLGWGGPGWGGRCRFAAVSK